MRQVVIAIRQQQKNHPEVAVAGEQCIQGLPLGTFEIQRNAVNGRVDAVNRRK
jgi:hypothetical protein